MISITPTYVSLFSSAGVGCYGFKQEGFYCIATVELLEKRLKIQRYNDKCTFDSGYICGDLTKDETKDLVRKQLEIWKNNVGIDDLDVVIATPPCQGMSSVNQKKKNEKGRNSLVVESIAMVKELRPKFFVFENVRAFLTSICTDLDGKDKCIAEAILTNLLEDYIMESRILNFKDYGCPSSRTRTLVIGVRRDLKADSPSNFFPDRKEQQTLRSVIGHLKPLNIIGEIDPTDIYHSFKKYPPYMREWIRDLKEGESAMNNVDPTKRPHKTTKDGELIFNKAKVNNKYERQFWDKVAKCLHTRNDTLSSQSTIHPSDDRVFSIRELMLMMSIPNDFKWTDKSFLELNTLTDEYKEEFLKKEEMNIRQSIGEAVPTIIFQQIAKKIYNFLLNLQQRAE